jgi:hypothetical protein
MAPGEYIRSVEMLITLAPYVSQGAEKGLGKHDHDQGQNQGCPKSVGWIHILEAGPSPDDGDGKDKEKK